MKLQSLTLDHYRSHQHTVLDFNSFGTIIFLGDNGSGKSSIAGALKWVTFGTEDPADELMYEATEGYVKLVFEESGSEYLIRRTLKRTDDRVKSKLIFKVKVNGVWEKFGDSGLGSKINTQKKIEDIIKADEEIFSHTSFVEEGEIDALMKLKPKDRLDVFSRPEGLLVYEAGAKLIKRLLHETNVEYKMASEKILDFKIGYRDKFDQDSNSIDRLL